MKGQRTWLTTNTLQQLLNENRNKPLNLKIYYVTSSTVSSIKHTAIIIFKRNPFLKIMTCTMLLKGKEKDSWDTNVKNKFILETRYKKIWLFIQRSHERTFWLKDYFLYKLLICLKVVSHSRPWELHHHGFCFLIYSRSG